MPLFSWGANSYGQLGLGHCDDAWTPNVVSSCPFDEIKTIAGGGGHSVMIGGNGRIAACGNNSKGQIGADPSIKKITQFVEIPLFSSPVLDVSCGWEHTLITTADGRIFGLGCNGYGQLALDGQQAATSKPSLISDVPDVVKTASGLRHSMALTRDGRVYCWGEGRRGQLGRKAGVDKWKPMVLEAIPDRVTDIVAGQHHSAALTEDGHVYVWGCNKHGQLGIDPEKTATSYEPMRITELPEDIISIHSGWSHLIACTSDGRLFGWGRSCYGQIGASPTKFTTIGYSRHAIELENFRCCISNSHRPLLGCGSEHNLGLDISDGVLRSWGWNEHGMCGLGLDSDDIIYGPRTVPGSSGPIQMIACGCGHSLVLTLPE